MNPPAPEFSRPLAVDRVPRGGSFEKIEASVDECRALALRFEVPAVHMLRAQLHVTPWRGGGLKLDGTITADVEQVSVVSLEAFRQDLTFALLRYFMPAGAVAETDDAEIDPIAGGRIDLGEVVAEALALELDPYPRRPGEAFADVEESDGPAEVTPFAALTRLKPPP